MYLVKHECAPYNKNGNRIGHSQYFEDHDDDVMLKVTELLENLENHETIFIEREDECD